MSRRSQQQRYEERNGQKPCDIRGCPKKRHGRGRYCKRHQNNASRNGDPVARAIRVYEFASSIKKTEEILSPWKSHPATLAAAAALEDLIQLRVHAPEAAIGHLKQVRESGASGYDALVRVCAVELFREHSVRTFANDRHFWFHLSKVFLSLATRKTRVSLSGDLIYIPIPAVVSSFIAQYVTRRIGVYLGRFIQFVRTLADQPRKDSELMATAFIQEQHNGQQ